VTDQHYWTLSYLAEKGGTRHLSSEDKLRAAGALEHLGMTERVDFKQAQDFRTFRLTDVGKSALQREWEDRNGRPYPGRKKETL